jgi:hypothetical protein
LLGSVDVAPQPRSEPELGVGQEAPGQIPPRPLLPLPAAGTGGSNGVPPAAAVDAGQATSPDAGADAGDVSSGPDAAPPPPAPLLPRPVLVDAPATTLERIGVEGGEPHLGLCEQGFVIGVRPTANPGEEVFGQRLTFVEPICGTAQGDALSGALRVTRDDSILRWDESGDFQGAPTTDVPDERLIWQVQSAPALVGVTGEYDPVAPDGADSAVIRSLVIECAPLAIAPNGIDVIADGVGHQLIARADSFAAGGEEEYRSACEAGTVVTQLVLHAGFWLDGFVVGCSSLRSPQPGGAACAEARDCQSGVCSDDGACSP